MGNNRNRTVLDLLSWHGHDQGGVRVPFVDRMGKPLRDVTDKPLVIRTPLIAKLEKLAADVASGRDCPRIIFLVGGPGNGKSEAVHEFLTKLDAELDSGGTLITELRRQFKGNPIVPWRVEIRSDPHRTFGQKFDQTVGRLIAIQDASASNKPDQDAAGQLVRQLGQLTTDVYPLPIFICCVNRGLLARALKFAYAGSSLNHVLDLLRALVKATALGRDALSRDRPICWPLELPGNPLEGSVACWPLDMESLLTSQEDDWSESPVNQIFQAAVEADRWEEPGNCADCDSRTLCPFRQNAEWLRNSATRSGLMRILRRGELAIGQRWNFRDAFSLTAELIVGEWSDFQGYSHPCDWVHGRAQVAGDQSDTSSAARAAAELLGRLYPQSLFADAHSSRTLTDVFSYASAHGLSLSESITGVWSRGLPAANTHIRDLLTTVLRPILDPLMLSPHLVDHPVAQIEDSFSQSIETGRQRWPEQAPPSAIESAVLSYMESAEKEWDPLARDSAQVTAAITALRAQAALFVKRSVGTRLGAHANEEALSQYEKTIRNQPRLDTFRATLRSLLGQTQFRVNALDTFGQPQSDRIEDEGLVYLQGPIVPLAPITPAPRPSENLPAHDLPFMEIHEFPMALTFDLFSALLLRQQGCATSSLPASVRASLDRIRQLYAGNLVHNREKFVLENACFVVRSQGQVVLESLEGNPRFRDISS